MFDGILMGCNEQILSCPPIPSFIPIIFLTLLSIWSIGRRYNKINAMLKINIYLKFALIGLFLGGGIVCAFLVSFWWALPLILIGLGFLASYILLGTVQSAAEMIQNQDFVGAEKQLKLTWKPQFLYAANRAYYYMLKGTIALQNRNTEEGEKWLRKAQEVKVPTDNEKAMIELQLANIAASKNKWQQAHNHIRKAKQLNITEPTIKEQFKYLEKVFASRGNQKAAMSMGKEGMKMMRQGGKGKRRRPKMR